MSTHKQAMRFEILVASNYHYPKLNLIHHSARILIHAREKQCFLDSHCESELIVYFKN